MQWRHDTGNGTPDKSKEYCKTRALPTIAKSQYLLTLGSHLNQQIDVMWTGNKVIPEVITRESIEELVSVLRRKPVIWDNIHANDYDQRRVFLGAYCGRRIDLYPLLGGILTNPNCEFEANFVPIHTLGTWCRLAAAAAKRDAVETVFDSSTTSEAFDDVAMDELLDDDACPESPSDCQMQDLETLTAADVTSVVSEYDPKHALRMALADWLEEFKVNKQAPVRSYSKRNLKSQVVNGQTVLTATSYNLDIPTASFNTLENMRNDKKCSMDLTEDSLILLTDLFCLPYGYGDKGVQLLEEMTWLLSNAGDIYESPPSKEKVSRWYDRLLKFESHCQAVYDLFELFCRIPNEAILYDLYPYLWDLKEVLLSLDTFVHWLANANLSSIKLHTDVLQQDYTKYAGHVMSDYIEPWHALYLGGLTIALFKLLPFKGGYLFLDEAPDRPVCDLMHVRPYSKIDKEALYQFCAFEDSEELVDIDKIDLPGDREIGAYLAVCPKTTFTVEDASGVCGYIAAVPDNLNFQESLSTHWLPGMNMKYPDVANSVGPLPYSDCPVWRVSSAAHLVVRLNKRARTTCNMKRIFSAALSVLKSAGAVCTYCCLESEQDAAFYASLGFYPLAGEYSNLLWRAL